MDTVIYKYDEFLKKINLNSDMYDACRNQFSPEIWEFLSILIMVPLIKYGFMDILIDSIYDYVENKDI